MKNLNEAPTIELLKMFYMLYAMRNVTNKVLPDSLPFLDGQIEEVNKELEERYKVERAKGRSVFDLLGMEVAQTQTEGAAGGLYTEAINALKEIYDEADHALGHILKDKIVQEDLRHIQAICKKVLKIT